MNLPNAVIDVEKLLNDLKDTIGKMATGARKRIRKPTIYTQEDLVNEGVLAILEKLKYYDERKGASLKTFFTKTLINRYSVIVYNSYLIPENNTQRNDSSDPEQEAIWDSIIITLSPEEKVLVEFYLGGNRKVGRPGIGSKMLREKLRKSFASLVGTK